MTSSRAAPPTRSSAGPWWDSSRAGSRALWLRNSCSSPRQDWSLLLPGVSEIDSPGARHGVVSEGAARIRHVSRIETPSFYVTLEQMGRPIPFDFRRTAGITFFNTVLIARSERTSRGFDSLYFHECVHIVQYHLLGIDNFIERYVNGWAQNGFSYPSTPLEQTAYDLQRAFEANP